MTSNTARRIAHARLVKAARIAAVLAEIDCDADTARRLGSPARTQAENVAGVRPASEETWALVAEMLSLRPHGKQRGVR